MAATSLWGGRDLTPCLNPYRPFVLVFFACTINVFHFISYPDRLKADKQTEQSKPTEQSKQISRQIQTNRKTNKSMLRLRKSQTERLTIKEMNKQTDKEMRENGIYWKDQKDDVDGVTIPTPYLQQFFLHISDSR